MFEVLKLSLIGEKGRATDGPNAPRAHLAGIALDCGAAPQTIYT